MIHSVATLHWTVASVAPTFTALASAAMVNSSRNEKSTSRRVMRALRLWRWEKGARSNVVEAEGEEGVGRVGDEGSEDVAR